LWTFPFSSFAWDDAANAIPSQPILFHIPGGSVMSSGQAFANLDGPIESDQSSIPEAMRGSVQLAVEPPIREGAHATEDESAEVTLVNTEVDGARYRLDRIPRVSGPGVLSLLPFSRTQPERRTMTARERRLNIGDFRRVLVVEQDRVARRNLQEMLREWGFEVVMTKPGIDILKMLEQQKPPDLVILNRTFPGIDGDELCHLICDHASEYPPYILMLAKQDEKQEIENALELGADDYLTTPFDAQELRARLIVATRILKRQESLISSRNQFRIQATKDALTGVWNRRAVLEIFENELGRAVCSERSTGILLVDLDRFKSVNDTYGHLAGDLVLQETVRRLSSMLRTYDWIGRYGGEEFLIIVPGTNKRELCDLGKRLCTAIEREPIHLGPNKVRITLSIGAAIAPACEKSTVNLIAVADTALYNGKKMGGNRTVYGTQRTRWIIGAGRFVPALEAS
jgi:two-component system cell cycle response regulator